jgi:hypothetical protein
MPISIELPRRGAMPLLSKCLVIVAISTLSGIAAADETQEFVKITCTPGAGEFRLEYVTIDYHEAFGDPATAAGLNAKWKELNARGLFNPMRLTRECTTGGVKYQISTDQLAPSAYGMCAASPTIYLSLQRNRKPIFEHVAFGSLCSHEANIKSAAALGVNAKDMEVCGSRDGDDAPVCVALTIDGEVDSRSLPVDAMGLRSLLLNDRKRD